MSDYEYEQRQREIDRIREQDPLKASARDADLHTEQQWDRFRRERLTAELADDRPSGAYPAGTTSSDGVNVIIELFRVRSLLLWAAAFAVVYFCGWWHALQVSCSAGAPPLALHASLLKIMCLLLGTVCVTSPTARDLLWEKLKQFMACTACAVVALVGLGAFMWLLYCMQPTAPAGSAKPAHAGSAAAPPASTSSAASKHHSTAHHSASP